MRVGQARRRDTNEKPIVDALRKAGATVIRMSERGAPDLLVFYRSQWFAGEVKRKGGTLTQAQQEAGAGSVWPVWETPEQALQAIGATK